MDPVEAREITIRNDLAELDGLTGAVLEFCRGHGVDEETCHDLRLVLDESVSNVIRHGYADRDPHEIRIRVRLENREIALEIEDDARPYDPRKAPQPDLSRPIEERPRGGLGVHLMRQLMHGVEYRREGGRNHLRMTRRLHR